MIRDSFFTNVQSWSKRKHRLLANYLRPFSAKVGSIAPLIHCVDAFAGAGKYDDGPARQALLAHLRHTAEQELAVANPRFLERVKG